MTASSFLVPAAGILTQPILARGLGVDGRGALAAVIAPSALAVSVATLGLPEALTYFLAKHPHLTRRALVSAASVTTGLGVLSLLATFGALPFLSTGDASLGNLILLATVLIIPVLVIGVFRGAAAGHQMWSTIAWERVLNTSLRILAFFALWISGYLTVFTAVLVSSLSPIVAGIVYFRLLFRNPRHHAPAQSSMVSERTLRPLVSFGSRMWVGAVASMLLARIGQILMAPLSSVAELGLYSVAGTISDVPLIVAIAIQGTLYGVNSKVNDAGKLTATTRLTLLFGFVGCSLIAITLPFWIGPLFGPEFVSATVPTLILLLSALICIPGLMAATGCSAWGRPGLRSTGLGITLVANLSVFVLLVPKFGVMGACWTSIVSNVVMTSFMVIAASRVMGVSPWDFVVVRRRDVAMARGESSRLVRQIMSRAPGIKAGLR